MKVGLALGLVAVPLSLLSMACGSVTKPAPTDEAAGGTGGDGGTGNSGNTGNTGNTGEETGGAGGGGLGECGPGGALDCHCPGGYFECRNDQFVCVCPPECTSTDQCGDGALCVLYDGYCGRDAPGYCQSLAQAEQWDCSDREPTCGCDGNLYDSYCAAVLAGVSPNAAPPSDCTAAPIPCGDWDAAVTCYPTQYCMVWEEGGSLDDYCSGFDGDCAEPSCACISYNEDACDCQTLPSGLVRLTCHI